MPLNLKSYSYSFESSYVISINHFFSSLYGTSIHMHIPNIIIYIYIYYIKFFVVQIYILNCIYLDFFIVDISCQVKSC